MDSTVSDPASDRFAGDDSLISLQPRLIMLSVGAHTDAMIKSQSDCVARSQTATVGFQSNSRSFALCSGRDPRMPERSESDSRARLEPGASLALELVSCCT